MSLLLGILMRSGATIAPRVFLQQRTTTANNSNATATAQSRFDSAGTYRDRENFGTYTTRFTWLLTGSAVDYDVRATVTAGSLTTGSQAWQAGNSNPTWTKEDPVSNGGFLSVTFTLEIRDASTEAILATQTGMVLRARRVDI